jgi:hypothetical protein
MSKINVEIEVRDREAPKPWQGKEMKAYNSKTRIYFFHEGENVLEMFGNRAARPSKLYATYLGDVAEKMGLPRTTKFKWSQKAGCACGCSPGFIADEIRRDVFVTLSGTPKIDPEKKDVALARTAQLVGQLAAEGMFK